MEFLDYGGREEVKVSTLRALSSQFTGLPVQGIKCCLYGERECVCVCVCVGECVGVCGGGGGDI